RDPEVEEYVLVEFTGKNGSAFYYIGKVQKIDSDGDYEVTFLRGHANAANSFMYPDVSDIASVSRNDIRCVLPKPVIGTTKRQSNSLSFGLDFGTMKVS